MRRGADLLCEREHELAVARAAIVEAAAGDGSLVCVEGPAGIGKTRLLEAIAHVAAGVGFQIHQARCDELESGLAYGALRQLLAPGLARLDPSVRAVVLEGPASVTAALVEGRNDRADTRVDDDALLIAHGLYRLLQNIAERSPQMLVVDDAHWADASSLEAVGYLVRRLDGLPVLAAIGCRLPIEGRVGDRLARMRSVPQTRRLTPAPLSEHAVASLAEDALGDSPKPGLPSRLWHVTGGNPFFVHELLAAHRAGAPAWDTIDDRDGPRLVPERVAESVLGRVTAAGDAAARLADAVAVLGEARLHDATTLAALDEAEGVAAADRLAAADVLTSGAQVRFVHPIARQAIRAHISPARLALAHARAARLLSDRGTPLDHVAAHLLEALPRADPWVTTTLLAAATQQQQRGSPETAVALLLRARDEPPPQHLRQPVTVALAHAQARSDHPQAATTAREALAGAHGSGEKAEAALHLVRTLGLSGDPWSALDLLHELTVGRSGVDPDLALQLEAELLGVARFQADTRPEALVRLDRLAPRARPARRATRVLLANLALSALERNQAPHEVAELARMALADGWPADDVSFQLVYAFEALTWTDHLDDAARAADAVMAAAHEGSSLSLSALGLSWRASINLRRGAVADAEADARISYDLIAGAAPWRIPFHRAHLADALLVRGEVTEAARVLADPEPDEQADDNPFYLDSRGRLHLMQGHARAGLEDFRACGQALARRGGVDAPATFPWRSRCAFALQHLGEGEQARELARDELALATAGQVPGAIGEALITVSLVEDGDAGVRRLHDALEVLQDSPRVLIRVRALTELGAMLRRNGQPRTARDHLATALDLAHRHGATALADRAHEELVIAGGRPRRATRTGIDALTPGERRVAQHVAQGLTNRQVAHSLFVSTRTVTTHLTHIYQKLGISSRTHLTRLLTSDD